MTTKKTTKNEKPVETKPVESKPETTKRPDMAPGAASDGLKGRIGTRTHAIHVVLMSHYPKPIPRAVIVAESVELLGADHPSVPKFAQTLGSHMNTMRLRGFVEKRDGGWVLTDAGRAAAGLPDPNAKPAKPRGRRGRK